MAQEKPRGRAGRILVPAVVLAAAGFVAWLHSSPEINEVGQETRSAIASVTGDKIVSPELKSPKDAHAPSPAPAGPPQDDTEPPPSPVNFSSIMKQARNGDMRAAKLIVNQYDNTPISTENDEAFYKQFQMTEQELETLIVATRIKGYVDALANPPSDSTWEMVAWQKRGKQAVSTTYELLLYNLEIQADNSGGPFNPMFLKLLGLDKTALQDTVRSAVVISEEYALGDDFDDEFRAKLRQKYEIE